MMATQIARRRGGVPRGAQRVGPCRCGGQVVSAVDGVTVEAGGQVVTQMETITWCTECGDEWEPTE